MIVVMPYQLKPKGTMRTTGGLFGDIRGRSQKGLVRDRSGDAISLAARVRRRPGPSGITPIVELGRGRARLILECSPVTLKPVPEQIRSAHDERSLRRGKSTGGIIEQP